MILDNIFTYIAIWLLGFAVIIWYHPRLSVTHYLFGLLAWWWCQLGRNMIHLVSGAPFPRHTYLINFGLATVTIIGIVFALLFWRAKDEDVMPKDIRVRYIGSFFAIGMLLISIVNDFYFYYYYIEPFVGI